MHYSGTAFSRNGRRTIVTKDSRVCYCGNQNHVLFSCFFAFKLKNGANLRNFPATIPGGDSVCGVVNHFQLPIDRGLVSRSPVMLFGLRFRSMEFKQRGSHLTNHSILFHSPIFPLFQFEPVFISIVSENMANDKFFGSVRLQGPLLGMAPGHLLPKVIPYVINLLQSHRYFLISHCIGPASVDEQLVFFFAQKICSGRI